MKNKSRNAMFVTASILAAPSICLASTLSANSAPPSADAQTLSLLGLAGVGIFCHMLNRRHVLNRRRRKSNAA
jgi:hypothetical protein